jgi:glycosyltransferase involved in cell wall biosynthesis
MVPPAARRAHRIVTGSAAARDDIVAELGVPAERIEVVPHGIVPAAAVDATAAAAARHALAPAGRSLVLSVATDVVHKNLPALLRGLALVDPARRPMLAFAGHGTDTGALPALARELGVAPDVRFLGAVAPGELEELYAAADALVTATRYEGFGLPVLEAMARDVPVACSDLPVLREVAGDAAVWLDPGAPASIAAALGEVLAGGQAIERLRAAGRERAARFTWEAAARATAGAYERALSATTKTRLA